MFPGLYGTHGPYHHCAIGLEEVCTVWTAAVIDLASLSAEEAVCQLVCVLSRCSWQNQMLGHPSAMQLLAQGACAWKTAGGLPNSVMIEGGEREGAKNKNKTTTLVGVLITLQCNSSPRHMQCTLINTGARVTSLCGHIMAHSMHSNGFAGATH